MAGYSKRSLKDKLGIKDTMSLSVIDAPKNYFTLVAMPASNFLPLNAPDTDFIHLFANTRANLLSRFPMAIRCLATSGMLWVSWPKQASGLQTDLDATFVRGYGLSQGLVDVKVAAIDATWSGLKFVYRLKDR